eukprot:CAMPEP_0195281292 /NCGR_PEP_ID=MMETSP0707-20130614/668_1 /TAXON_ID=33640 /ORGANISM="Asterionellopsis glacialis, Strain CCMP134" /LENGTH=902 /DNA_ID=CAMNT_0040340167 /DNA_START=144 /DNA_END=2852 /DNA_ORIENTATION=-
MFGTNWLPSDLVKGAVSGATSALERAGDTLTKGATTIQKQAQDKIAHQKEEQKGQKGQKGQKVKDDDAPPPSSPKSTTNTTTKIPPSVNQMTNKLQAGWGTFVESTKSAIETTQHLVEKEQSKLFKPKGPYKRDPKLSLDVESLKDAEVVYITNRLISMGHPAMQSSTNGDITPDRKLAAVGQLLEKRHSKQYMVWNLSEVEYDVSVLDDQVLTFQFPGSPSPPLGLLLKLLISMESWLKADDRNVAVVHCLTGKGRSSTVLAAFLCWTGEAGFANVHDALEYIAKCKHLASAEELTIPSQRRYASYFANMLDGVRPSQPPLMLKRIIMSSAPRFSKGPPQEGSDKVIMGCAPYIQVFKAGQLIVTTAACVDYDQPKDALPFCTSEDGSIAFNVEAVVQGDILLRCRHLTKGGQRLSMFRAAFHTGYVPPSVMRLQKAQLDGACSDKRFGDEYFIDLIFEACDAEMASKHLLENKKNIAGKGSSSNNNNNNSVEGTTATSSGAAGTYSRNEAEERRRGGTLMGGEAAAKNASKQAQAAANATKVRTTNIGGGGATVTASAYDSMLHRDSRFWDVIATRRQENMAKRVQQQQQQQQQQQGSVTLDGENSPSKNDTTMEGPTIGKRRVFNDKKKYKTKGGGKISKSGASATSSDANEDGDDNGDEEQDRPTELFSIGGEFDFLPDDMVLPDEQDGDTSGATPLQVTDTVATTVERSPPPKKERDELMDALMAIDDEAPLSPEAAPKLIAASNKPAEPPAATVVALPPLEAERPIESSSSPNEKEDEAPSFTTAVTQAEESKTTTTPKDSQVEEEKEEVTAAADVVTTSPVLENEIVVDLQATLEEEADADLDLDTDMDALLADAGDDDGNDDDDLGNLDDLLDADDDDAELEDLENFLTQMGTK